MNPGFRYWLWFIAAYSAVVAVLALAAFAIEWWKWRKGPFVVILVLSRAGYVFCYVQPGGA